jgi:hypothetical protein
MSHFCLSQDSDAVADKVYITGSSNGMAFVWGGASGEEYGQLLEIWSQQNDIRIPANESTPRPNWIVSYTIPASVIGLTFVGVKRGTTIRETSNTIKVETAPAQRLLDFTGTGRLRFLNPTDITELHNIADGRSKVRLSDGLSNLLFALLDNGPLGVLSMIRTSKGGPHGIVGRSGILCTAVDFSAFQGTPVSLADRDSAIDVVTSLIRAFPAGSYDLGFPRPVGGATGFDPASDVFFPVRDLETAGRCFAGTIALPLSAMLEPARTKIGAAIAASSGRFNLLFPDGLNHLHVKVLQS